MKKTPAGKTQDVLSRAILLAIKAHENQKRKNSNLPYIHHPLQVGIILAREGFSDIVIAAGILHDVVEDTNLTYDDLVQEVGKKVADLVMDVTEPSKDHSWEERKNHTIEHLKTASKEAVALKAADMIHNRRDTISDYKTQGKTAFSKFKKDMPTILEKDRRALKVFRLRLGDSKIVNGLEECIKELEELIP